MTQVIIGVALPVYNGADYLREALDSILAQNYTDFVLYVSDNCSTDETPQILAEYAARDSRVRVDRSDVFLSQVQNVNRATRMCDTTWIKLFCHDDLMEPHCLSRLKEVIDNHADSRVAVVGDYPALLFANGYKHSGSETMPSVPRLWNGRELIQRHLLNNNPDPLPALTTGAVRRDVFMQTAGFDEAYIAFDTFYWTTLLMNWDYIYIPEALTWTRIHGSQVTAKATKTVRFVHDYILFYPKFVQEYQQELDFSTLQRLRVRLKPASMGSSMIAIQLLKRRFKLALEIALGMPFYWLPLLPPLIVRSYQQLQRRSYLLQDNVPLHMQYPG